MATVYIPTPLRPYAGNQESLELGGSTVSEVLANLTEQYGDLKKHLFSEEGKLRNFVNIYVNDVHVRFHQGLRTPLCDGDQVYVVPLVMGG